jgi:hypothetical protein
VIPGEDCASRSSRIFEQWEKEDLTHMQTELVAVPMSGRWDGVVAQVAACPEGKSVLVKLEGSGFSSVARLTANLRAAFKYRKLKVRTRRTPNGVNVWPK